MTVSTTSPPSFPLPLDRRFAVDGIELPWQSWDESTADHDAAPVLLLHGHSGSSHDYALHIPSLAEIRRVVTYDQRGHGRGPKLGDVGRYSLARLVADLIALIDEAVGEPVDLVGHSMGGYVAMSAAIERPDLVRSLFVFDTSGWAFAGALARLLHELAGAYDPASGLPAPAPPGPEFDLIVAATPLEWRRFAEQSSAGYDPYALKGLGGELVSPDIPSLRQPLSSFDRPATVVMGSEDADYVGQGDELAAAFGDGELHVIDGAYHSPQLTHQAEWRSLLDRHLARSTQ